MMPISNYKELIQTLNWDTEKRTKERWYVFLIMNPKNQTNAGADIIKNFSYLDVRSGNVTLFLPGFSNMDQGVVPYRSEHGDDVVYEDTSFGKIYFDQRGFLETIDWLEEGSGHTYRYSEDLDLVIVRYRPRYTEPYGGKLYEQNFDLINMVVYNLDSLRRESINTIRMITECRRIVADSKSEREVRQRLENFIFDRTVHSDRHWHHKINIFVAGSKDLKIERDAVLSSLTHVTNNSSRDYVFRMKTFEDFDRSLSVEGRQTEYNNYIAHDADYAIFILDNSVGGITFEEFEVAMTSFKRNGRPEIYVYSKINGNNGSETDNEIKIIQKFLSQIGQYYIEYRDIDDLKYKISYDFRRYGL